MRPAWWALLLGLAAPGQAEKLPLKIYTAADGLAHNSVNQIVRDSGGYLWFGTSEGLSRFDGYEFHSYGRRDGLPHRVVNDVLETRSGELWIATAGGLCRYAPKRQGNQRFRVYAGSDDRASHLNVLLEDSRGGIWCGTDAGLFRLERRPGQTEPVLRSIDLGMPPDWDDQVVNALLRDPRGDLWAGTSSGLYRLRAEGGLERYTESDGLPHKAVTVLLRDQQQRIWAGTRGGLCKLIADPVPGRKVVEAVFREKDGLGSDSIEALYQLTDGTLFVGTKMGLSAGRTARPVNSPAFSPYTALHGLPASGVTAMAEDTAGNLWIGTDGSGAAKLVWNTFLTYTADDGLAGSKIDAIFEDGAGKLCVVTRQGNTQLYVNEFDGRRFRTSRVNLPEGTRLLNWGARSQCIARDGERNWWIGTGDGLLLYSEVRRAADLTRSPAARYTERDGLPEGPIVSVFEDSAGSLWVSTTGKRNGLARWDRRERCFHRYSEGLPWLGASGVSLFAEDGSAGLWMGLLRFGRGRSEMARFRGAAVELFGGADESASSGGIRALHLDRQKRLWVGTDQNGLMRFDNPESDRPALRRYTTADGLSSDLILSLTEDLSGRIYAGNGSGVDRLDAATGQVNRYTSADGLAPGEVHAAYRDASGVLWFGTEGGLSRLLSPPARPSAPRRISITSLVVHGIRQPTSDLGETEVSGLRYGPDQNDVEVSFAGLEFAPGETLRYQYMLQGTDGGWSAPSLERSVHYANLAPASYRFLVRAINSEGVASPQPASISFLILPPVWLRWWFQLLAVAVVATAVYRLHRYRVARLLELERVRTRIATDLHDDIGSSLSQIAILSEVAGRLVDAAHPKLAEPLADIAGISRELVNSMSDIVWAIDPERDHVEDLTHRMRRFASDVLSPRDIRLGFQSPGEEQDLPMGADLRRQIFLIFKEAVHNVVRHSGATEAGVEIRVEHRWLCLRVADNGRGFDPVPDHEGHGLRSMRERALQVGGGIEIHSGPGGTTVALRVPVGRRAVQRAPSPHE